MSSEQIVKDVKTNDRDDNSKSVTDIKWLKLSEREIPNVQRIIHHRSRSEDQIKSNVNYDDLCGPWVYPENPVYSQYIEPLDSSLCVWKHFTKEDLLYLKEHQQEKGLICSFFENKILHPKTRENSDILTKILWQFFNFARLHSFTEKAISALLGIVYSTHLLFLSHPWRTVKEVYQYFYKTVLLHVVLVCIVFVFERACINHVPNILLFDSGSIIASYVRYKFYILKLVKYDNKYSYENYCKLKKSKKDPPKCMEIFTVAECKLLFKAFHEMYVKNLVSIHVLCHPHYCFTVNLQNLASSVQDD